MKLRIIPLGGQSDVTKNMYVYEYWEEGKISDILLVDCGVGFLSRLEYLGVDFVIPDVSYLKDKLHLIRAMLITHGHDDHIGAVPYILPQLEFPPIFAPKLAKLLIADRLEENGIKGARLNVIKYHFDYTFGKFRVRFIHMTHSIPDTTHILLETPLGNIYHGSDFKFDLTPVYSDPPDFQEIVRAGTRGIKLLLSDGLGSEREGYTLSERVVGNTFVEEMRACRGRFFMTTFASNISRIKQCVEAALVFNRKVCFLGRTMKRNMQIALSEGYIKLNPEHIIREEEVKRLSPNKLCFIVTGSQGEFGSALDKIASRSHKTIKIQKGDKILFSSDPIPGNEIHIQDLIEEMLEQGADVVYTAIREQLHASGHGSQEDLKLLVRLVKPQYLTPIGTTIKHSKAYLKLMKTLGYRDQQMFVLHSGEPLVIEKNRVYSEKKIPLREMLVDGGLVGDVGETILEERQTLGKEGVLIIVVLGEKIDFISKGFVFYEKKLFEQLKGVLRGIIKKNKNPADLPGAIIKEVGDFLYSRLQRSPVIIPIIRKGQ